MGRITRRTMMGGTGLAGLALGLGFGRALAAEPSVRNETSGMVVSDLSAAMSAAAPGDVLTLSGWHVGQFTVPKPLTLRGDGTAVIDAPGTGTALVVAADDVTIEALSLTGSGRSAGALAFWGDAGLRVGGNRARLRALTVTGNDWGVIFHEGEGSLLTGATVTGNHRQGVLAMGGHGHRIELSEVALNGVGIVVRPFQVDVIEADIPDMDDIEAMRAYSAALQNRRPASGMAIAQNRVFGNATFGIALFGDVRECEVLGNEALRTGLEIEPDPALLAAGMADLSGALGGDVGAVERMFLAESGIGILLSCLPQANRVADNHSHDNRSFGIAVSSAGRNRIEANAVSRNRIGINLVQAADNEVLGNAVRDNAEFGIRIDSDNRPYAVPLPSTGNLVAGNDMTANRVNAFDSSDRTPDIDEIAARIEYFPLPKEAHEAMLANPQARRIWAQGMLAGFQPGANRWDDGTIGNHYDDFDEASEGFTDADGDGVSEVVHPIPGGGMADHFPLTAARAAAL